MDDGLKRVNRPNSSRSVGINQYTMPTLPILAADTRVAIWVRAPIISIAERMNISQAMNTFGISAAKHCIEIAPEYADGYLLLGLLQMENKQKEEARKNLEKAKELGDTRAEGYLKKLK